MDPQFKSFLMLADFYFYKLFTLKHNFLDQFLKKNLKVLSKTLDYHQEHVWKTSMD